LSIGQELVIKASDRPDSNVVTTPVSTDRLHVVEPKETMFSISKRYGVTINEIRDWNKLEGNEISIGQELIVGPPKATAKRETPQPIEPKVEADKPLTPSKAEVKEQTIRISESVKNSDEITQSGLAELIEGTEGNRKYLALHRTAPVGTILKVRNEMNNREVFVRVMGKLPDTPLTNKLVIKISKSAYDRLAAIDSRFRVEVTYYK
jgi:LysM repeat protein